MDDPRGGRGAYGPHEDMPQELRDAAQNLGYAYGAKFAPHDRFTGAESDPGDEIVTIPHIPEGEREVRDKDYRLRDYAQLVVDTEYRKEVETEFYREGLMRFFIDGFRRAATESLQETASQTDEYKRLTKED
mgnify:CR=1 FL=1